MTPSVDSTEMPFEIPLRTITPEEGVVLVLKAFKRGQARPIQFDCSADTIQQRSCRPDPGPVDPVR